MAQLPKSDSRPACVICPHVLEMKDSSHHSARQGNGGTECARSLGSLV